MRRRYDRQIIIQRKTVTQSPSGEEIEAWTDLVYKCMAFKEATRGGEKFANPEKVANQEVTFTIRFHEIPPASQPLTPKDRVLYPVDALGVDEQAPDTYLIHDILSSDEVGREIDLSIKTVRRADVMT